VVTDSNNHAERPSESLRGKVALITGAGGFGIGTETASQLAARGAKVYLNGTNRENLQLAARQIRDLGGKCDVAVADVSDAAAVKAMVADIVSREGSLDVLVNNAAPGGGMSRVDSLSDEQWNLDVGTVLSGSFYCTRAATPSMIEKRWGKIIFLSSSAAFVGARGRSVSYVAAKAGLHGMTRQLALELGPFNIHVNAIAPSQVLTPRVMKNGRRTKESILQYGRNSSPLGRPGLPTDVAQLVCFLASENSSYITGQVIRIDGGVSLASATTATVLGENGRGEHS
jgi:3-oxoacyl-[acyl-carrier protein] reductase